MPRKPASLKENSNSPYTVKPDAGIARKKKVLLGNAPGHIPERAFAREIQNFIGNARSQTLKAGGDFQAGLEEPSLLYQLAEEFGALDLQGATRKFKLANLPEDDPDISTVTATASSQASTMTTLARRSNARTAFYVQRADKCPFCSELAARAPASGSGSDAGAASHSAGVGRCRCHRYSGVFNKRNSFRSIVSQSTPLQARAPPYRLILPLNAETGSEFAFSTPPRPAPPLPPTTSQGCAGTEVESQATDCCSDAMTQLTTQLHACVLSPCIEPIDTPDNIEDTAGEDEPDCSIQLPAQRFGRTVSLSLGYIPDAFPIEDEDFRFDR
ncbi:hypothetical protein DFH11DRAFT_1726723 [Phellopilus nigrolimitatus]|nr:hypothetical protein DFH11DRAFT_1726723 [Phellopilus nigrolimitatus]